MRLDLRTRLLVATGLLGLLQVAVAIAVVRSTQHDLIDQVDDRLTIATAGERRDRVPEPDHEHEEGDRTPPERLGDTYEGVLGADGQLTTFFAPNTTGEDLAPPDIGPDAAADANGRPTTVDSLDQRTRYRVVTRTLDGDRYYVTAIPLDSVEDTMRRLTLVVVATLIAVTLVLALVTWWVVRLGIAPIKRMTRSAEAIADGDLTERIADADTGTEAGALGSALNVMLGRIESSFADQQHAEAKLRQFIADASHELRTPVATIRGYAELYRAGGLADPDELDDAMRRTEQEAQRMSRLVVDMLDLAKLDRDPTLLTAPVDLAAVVRDIAADARVTHPDRRINVSGADPGTVTVDGDEDLLRRAITNAVTNAVQHTPDEATVDVAFAADPGRVVITIADDGPGMDPETARRATERFYRADPARSRHKGGSGLGLAIAESIVTAHHGRLAIISVVGEGTTVTIELPRA